MHRAMTWTLPNDDPLKFKYGTPDEVADAVRRTWAVCPTSERIVEDIQRFPAALDKIIAAQGAYVPELDKRTGRRARVTRRFVPHVDCAGAAEANTAKYAAWFEGAQQRSSPRRAADEESEVSAASTEEGA